MGKSIAFFIDSLSMDLGGPALAVKSLADAIATKDCPVFIVTKQCPSSYEPTNNFVVLLHYRKTPVEALVRLPNQVAIVINGLWLWSSHTVCAWCRENSIPYYIHPRGSLEPWSRKQRQFRKFIAWHTYQKNDILKAEGLIVASEQEAMHCNDLVTTKASIIPNGVNFETHAIAPIADRFKSNRILFLSRIHPKKGLENLIAAWNTIKTTGWKLSIAGVGEPEYVKSIKEICAKSPKASSIEWVGPAFGNLKVNLLSRSTYFILPTYSENFGIVVPEALAAGLPVITTTGTPWSILVSESIGWYVEPNPVAIGTALEDAICLAETDYSIMSSKAVQFALGNFSWEKVAEGFKESILGC